MYRVVGFILCVFFFNIVWLHILWSVIVVEASLSLSLSLSSTLSLSLCSMCACELAHW